MTHQDAVEVVPRHVGGGRRQQGPGLALVIRDEGLDPLVHHLVGQVEPRDALHLQGSRVENSLVY